MEARMGYFVDAEALYDDIRMVETDREQGTAILHHMVADPDNGYEPERPDAAQRTYDREIAPQIADEALHSRVEEAGPENRH
jgi:hypothetical protein